ncbi:VOC family protein [Salinactinospora qingdaonensis]|uniref:VOC family protein n=1 Tax=Salinactinospora qingdaonensis TaxID=702744 RepID=A0ABP7G8B1_9ACTN
MNETPTYTQGAPAWFDMTVADLAATKRFYSTVLGWEFSDDAYSMASTGGKRVAGLAEPWSEGQAPPEQSNWTVYLATDDIDATLNAAEKAGGEIITARQDADDAGSMATVREPTGTVFALWQGNTMAGAEAFGTPGAPAWAEVATDDTQTAGDFYAEVFGGRTEQLPEGDFLVLYSGGTPVAGIDGTGVGQPHTGHGAWLVFFAVSDADAAVATAQEQGGSVLRAAEDSPYGRWAALTDPTGAPFSVIDLSRTTQDEG